MLLKYPSAKDIAKSRFDTFAMLQKADLTSWKLKKFAILQENLSVFTLKAMELKHTIKLIQVLDSEIAEIEQQI